MTQNITLYCPIQKLPKHLETHILHLEIGDNGYNVLKREVLEKLADFIIENFQIDDVKLLAMALNYESDKYYQEHF